MKALSITEPYASLIRDGVKTIETRSWYTAYRGPLLIHASATRIPKAWREDQRLMQHVHNVQRGYLLCKAELVDCVRMTDEFIASLPEAERETGFYSIGRYAWLLRNVEPIEPIPAKGRLGIWEYTQEV